MSGDCAISERLNAACAAGVVCTASSTFFYPHIEHRIALIGLIFFEDGADPPLSEATLLMDGKGDSVVE